MRQPGRCGTAWLLALLVAAAAAPAAAAERTFVWSSRELVAAVDEFNAAALAQSALLGRTVAIRQGALALGGKRCPSLVADPQRVLTRVRVLDGPLRAALLAGRRPNVALGAALASMGASLWFPPAAPRVRQPSWVIAAADPGTATFMTSGYGAYEQLGALTGYSEGEGAAFLLRVDARGVQNARPTELVLALTTELPPRRPGRRPKRTECFLLLPVKVADVQALVDLLAAAPVPAEAKGRLSVSLTYALYWLGNGQPQRAARNVKRFARELSAYWPTVQPPDAVEELLSRSLTVIEALGF